MQHSKFSFQFTLVYGIVFALIILVAGLTSTAVQAISETALHRSSRTIVIDAGHGGEDGGAISCTGVLESNINLAIALRLNDLMQFLGYKTRMIRTEDLSVYTAGESISQKKISDLKERVRICNEINNAILLSIHQNSFPDGRYSGAQVFYSSGTESQSLAEALQQSFVSTVNPGSTRGAKQAQGIYLMENVRCPGVLIECGFLSNPAEEAQLRNAIYQKKLCCVIAACYATFALDAQTND